MYTIMYTEEQLQEVASQLMKVATRMQMLRESMSEVEWHAFCHDHPHARDWFDEDGVPRY